MIVIRYLTTSCIEFDAIRAVVVRSSVLWDISPCSPLKVNLQATSVTLVSFSAYYSAQNMEATCFSETSHDSMALILRRQDYSFQFISQREHGYDCQ
jgi:hypothetical protein